MARRPEFRAQQPRLRRGHHFGGGPQLRHRVLTRARRLGPDGLRLPGRGLVGFADIFRNNSTKQGLPPGSGERGTRSRPPRRGPAEDPTLQLTIDVARGTIEAPAAGLSGTFPLDEFTRERLLNGWDDIGLSLRHVDKITVFERVGGPPSCLPPEHRPMVTFRQMTKDDVPGAVAAFERGLLGIPPASGFPSRGTRFRTSDGARIARATSSGPTRQGRGWPRRPNIAACHSPSCGRTTGCCRSWGPCPDVRAVESVATSSNSRLSHGDPDSPGTIQCSSDPKAMALYTGFGFARTRSAGWGALRPGAVTRPPEVIGTTRTRSASVSSTW